MAYVAWCRMIVGSFGSGCCFGIASHAGDSSQLVPSDHFAPKLPCSFRFSKVSWSFCRNRPTTTSRTAASFVVAGPCFCVALWISMAARVWWSLGYIAFKNGFKRGMERYSALTSIHKWWIVHSMLGIFTVQPSDNSEFEPFQWHFLLETSPFLGFHVATLPWSRGWPAPSLRTVAIARSTGRCCSCSRNALERWHGMSWSHRPLKSAGKSAINRGFDGENHGKSRDVPLPCLITWG